MKNAGFFEANSEPLAQRIATGLSKIGLALKHKSWEGAGGQGLSPTQGQILATLRSSEGLRLSEVADRLGVSVPTASDSVRVLVDKGLVKKTRDARDARALVLQLTDDGQRAAKLTSSWPDFLATAVDELSAEEQQVFFLGLMKMIRALQARGEIPVTGMCVSCRYFRPNAHESGEKPHHCALVDAPFGSRHLRIDCKEQEPADEATRERNWARFLHRGPSTT